MRRDRSLICEQPRLTIPGPRFALVGLWYLLTAKPGRTLPKAIAISGVVRTLTCGGWTYITSTDDHNWHDILMISYLVFTIPWTTGCLALSPPNATAIKYRKYLAGGFFGTLVPLVYFFIQHKVHRVAGGRAVPHLRNNSLLTQGSLHDIRILRMGVDPLRCRLRRCDCSGLQHVRGGSTGCQGREQGVRAMASEIAPGPLARQGAWGLYICKIMALNETMGLVLKQRQ